jgi:murein DD-endopeptidase MepM/ murein hydrolase activator NlpD
MVLGFFAGAAACGGPAESPEVKPAPTLAPTPARAPEPDLHGFAFPIAGACLPTSDRLMPNAPRAYRKGTHEGIDFYHSDNCTTISRGTEVLAAKGGHVVRVDASYVDVDEKRIAAYLKDPNTEASLDEFRGRQVWIDHGAGVVTRYCHLDGIADGIVQGMTVAQGRGIGFVGESGTPSSVRNPGHEYHLHFELRVGDSFLGRNLEPSQVRSLFSDAFGVPRK